MKARKLFRKLLKIFPLLATISPDFDKVYCVMKDGDSFFIPVKDVEWPETQRYTLKDYSIMEGIAFECLGLSWERVGTAYNYMAIDKDGEVYVYRGKPRRGPEGYMLGKQYFWIGNIKKKLRKKINWKECLWERPEVVK